MKILILSFTLCFFLTLDAKDFNSALKQIKQISSSAEKIQAFNFFYKKTLSPYIKGIDKEKIDAKNLTKILSDIELVAFYTKNRRVVNDYLALFNVLKTKKLAKSSHYQTAYNLLIMCRMLDEAQMFYQKYKKFELLPLPKIKKLKSNTGVFFYSIDTEQENTFIQESFVLSNKTQIIVVAHPNCHFCQRAANEIEKNKNLLSFFLNNSLWITPVDSTFEYDILFKWNNLYPSMELHYTHHEDDFPMLELRSTPIFYFLKNKKVIDKITGWPKEGRLEMLNSKIKKYFQKDLSEQSSR